MNNIFVLGKRIPRDSTVDYIPVTNHYMNLCSIVSRGSWRNPDELISSNADSELQMLMLVNNLSSSSSIESEITVEPGEKYCIFFKVPVDGKISIIRKNRSYLLIFQPLSTSNFSNVNLEFDGFRRECMIGNAIIITRRPDSDFFSDDHVRTITVEALATNLISRRPDRLMLSRRISVFSPAEIRRIRGIRVDEDRRQQARILATEKMSDPNLSDYLNLPESNAQLPIKEGVALPLFSFNQMSDLNLASLGNSIALGVAEIPYSDTEHRFLLNEPYTWFDCFHLFKYITFEPPWTFDNLSEDALGPLEAWHGHRTLDENRITEVKNQNISIYNPVQSERDNEPFLINYFFANRLHPVNISSGIRSNWFSRDYKRGRRLEPEPFSPATSTPTERAVLNIDNANDLLQVKASSLEEAKSFNVLMLKLATGGESDTIFESFLQNFGLQINGTAMVNAFSNAHEINRFFQEKTGYRDYIEWFHRSVKLIQFGDTNWFGNYLYKNRTREPREIGQDDGTRSNFTQVWNLIPLMFGTSHINIFQFFSLISVFINESSRLSPISEVGDMKRFFENKGKRSYNRSPNLAAGELFHNNQVFWEAHASLDTVPSVRAASRQAWNSESSYPRGYPNPRHSVRESTLESEGGIITQADFCKFRGRGLIQTTWRSAYLRLIEFVLTYSNSNPKILEMKQRWEEYGTNDTSEIATRSTNQQWDELFLNSDYEIPCKAVNIFQESKGNFLAIIGSESLTRLFSRERGSIYEVGWKVGGSENYGEVLLNRVKQQMKALVLDNRRITNSL